MRHILAAILMALASLLSSSCSPLSQLPRNERQAARQAEKVADFIAAHPELMKKDTVQVYTAFRVPEIHIRKAFYPVHDTIWLKQESTYLDSLLNNLATSLDSAQAAAAKAKVHQLLDGRPVLRDTLCFDTLGVAGKVWLTGRTYQLIITRAAISGQATGQHVCQVLKPCPPAAPAPAAAALPWYNPEQWALPWYLWFLLGSAFGCWLGCFVCVKLISRTS